VGSFHAHRAVPRRRSSAFSLIELLVVIAIVGVLISLLVPAVQRVREAANRAACRNNLRQLGLALHHYHESQGGFPPAKTDKTATHALVPFLLPYLEQEALSRRYDFTKDWNDKASNDQFPGGPNQTRLKVLLCPAAPADRTGTNGRGVTDYSPTVVITKPNPFVLNMPAFDPTFIGVLGYNTNRRLTDVTDGASNTLMMAEDAGREQIWKMGKLTQDQGSPGGWADPGSNLSVTGFNQAHQGPPGPCAVNCWNDNDVYGFHPAGANGLFADGSVRLLRAGMNINVLIPLMTRALGDGCPSGDDG
jgi:prepilin-type N-terminal cleavage/methylation domain-containing protein/prepilin-type processing-associated H-X9-DG protein